MLAEVIVVTVVVASILAIGKRVGVTVKRVTLRLCILSRVGVLIRGEVLVGEESVVVRAEIV